MLSEQKTIYRQMHKLLSLTRAMKATSYTTTSDSYQVTPLTLQPLNHDYIPQKAAQVLSTRTDELGPAPDMHPAPALPLPEHLPYIPYRQESKFCDQFGT